MKRSAWNHPKTAMVRVSEIFVACVLAFTLNQKREADSSTGPVTAKSLRSYFRYRQLASIQQRSPVE